MARVYIRDVGLTVALGATLAPHWVGPLRTTEDEPILFVAGMSAAVMLVMLRAFLANRNEARGSHAR